MVTIDPSQIDIPKYLFIYLSIFFATLFFTKKILWSIFDPLVLIIFSLSFNVATILYFIESISASVIFYVLFSYLIFILILRLDRSKYINVSVNDQMLDVSSFKITASLLVIIIFILLFSFILSKIGFGALTGDVDSGVKVSITQNGFGIFKYFNFLVNLLIFPIIFHELLVKNRTELALTLAAIYFIFSFVANFSKAGLLFLIFDISILFKYYDSDIKRQIIKFKYHIFWIGALAVVPIIFLFKTIISERGVDFTYLLLERFIDSGGGSFQYFILNGKEAFSDTDFSQIILYYFDTILSVLRFKEWEPLSHMAFMTSYLTGVDNPGFGVNPYIFVDGHLLFGSFGIFYVAAIGFAIIKSRSFKGGSVVYYSLNKTVLFFIGDPNTAQANMVGIILCILFFFIYFLANYKQKIYSL
jgi:hypothetical protein